MFHIFYKSFHESSVHNSHTVCLFRWFLSTAQPCRGQYQFLKTKEQLSNKWIITLSICICWNAAAVCATDKSSSQFTECSLTTNWSLTPPSGHKVPLALTLEGRKSDQQRRFSGVSVDWAKYLSARLCENYTNGAWRMKAGTLKNLPHNGISQHHIDPSIDHQSIHALMNICVWK